MNKFLHWVWCFVEVVVVVYVVAVTSLILCKNKYGYTQFGDYTLVNVDLMAERNIEGVKKGDLLLIQNSNDIKAGDIAYYYVVINDNYVVRSNVIKSVEGDQVSTLYTVGVDDTNTVAGTRMLGKYIHIYSGVGSILSTLESRIGFLFLVLLPIMIVFIYQVYGFVVILRYNDIEDDEELPTTKKVEKKELSKQEVKEEKEDKKPLKDDDIEIL